ncbi:MAG: nuclear transport factor 2 family protein [Acidimicrobiales bacterium]
MWMRRFRSLETRRLVSTKQERVCSVDPKGNDMATGSNGEQLQELVRDVERLKAERDIQRLILEQFDAADSGDFDRQADFFARARVQYVDGDTVILDVTDRDAFRNAISSATRIYEDGTPKVHHVVSNTVIDIAESLHTAESRCYTTVFRATDDFALQPIACGVFHDRFQRDEPGWYFVARVGRMRLAGAPSPRGTTT